jgi:hypothetical protein
MSDKKRRVFYCDAELYMRIKITSTLLGENLTDFIGGALRERIDRELTEEQRSRLFQTY